MLTIHKFITLFCLDQMNSRCLRSCLVRDSKKIDEGLKMVAESIKLIVWSVVQLDKEIVI